MGLKENAYTYRPPHIQSFPPAFVQCAPLPRGDDVAAVVVVAEVVVDVVVVAVVVVAVIVAAVVAAAVVVAVGPSQVKPQP